ncbi:MAG: DUF3783 domain-containing protein [Desulfatibacillaceae bacterium]
MADAKMSKVGDSDTRMHGERRVVACGYAPVEQEVLCEMVEHAGFADLPVVFCIPADGEVPLADIFAREDRYGMGEESRMPRAVILGGISENELRTFMGAWRELGLPSQLWAVLTPHSETWTLRRLVTELQREHKELQKQRKPR